jgi:AraC-like DNA-binding protein
MLAKQVDFGLSHEAPFEGVVNQWRGPTALDTDIHPSFEVGVELTGRHEMRFEDHVFIAEPGEATLSAAWEPHGWRCLTRQGTSVVVHFLPEFLGGEMIEGRSWLGLYAVHPAERPRIQTPAARRQVIEIGRQLRTEIEERPAAWQTMVRLNVMRVLVLLSRAAGERSAAAPSSRPDAGQLARIMPALRLVHSQRGRRTALGEAAIACGLSPSRLGVVFRRTMGLSFGRFALRTRLAYAARLLLYTDESVEAVAEEAGFADGSHFHHAFRKSYGRTPSRYREEGRRPSAAAG